MKKLIALICAFALVFSFAACSKKPGNEEENSAPAGSEGKNPVVTLNMEDGGAIVIELYPDVAPNTVKNFLSLASSGFFDGVIFHRIVPGFVIQGGDPEGTGFGGPGYQIKGEFTANGFENGLSHTRGVVSMARGAYSMDSAGSQFFICLSDDHTETLDGSYASFGKVIEGMDIVDSIAAVKFDSNSKPLEDVVIQNVTVETFGVEYGAPEVIK